MPGRTRRVRLLAVVACIATVFFLYERNVAGVDEYADYWTRNTVGGGAVIRKAQKDAYGQEQEPLYAPADEPIYRPTPARTSNYVPGWPKTTTPAIYTSSLSSVLRNEPALRPTPTPTPPPRAPHLYEENDDEDEEDSEVWDEFQSDGQHLDDDRPSPPRPRTTTVQHWSKLKEKFPIATTIQLPTSSPSPIPKIQKRGQSTVDKERRAKVKEACQHAWNGFRNEGWGYDEVRPVHGGGQNTFNGWGATLVDSLDTLWIMGLEQEFEEAVNKTAQIDFTTSSRMDIPLFEVTIRYLGGMLGAYDVSGKKHHVLLQKAVELGEILYSAFDTPNRVPETYYNWKPAFAENTHLASKRAVMAEIGTLSLEFTRLAQLTGEAKYYDAIARITNEFERWQNNTRLPGMWPTDMDASGCKIPERKVPTPAQPYHQVPVPGVEDRYMITSSPPRIDGDVVAKAEHAVDELSRNNGGAGRVMGSVANPINPLMGGGVRLGSAADSSLRHSMADDPWMQQDSLNRGETTNYATANKPLPPGAGSAEAGVTVENPTVGFRASDPLPPNAGWSHQKRDLEETAHSPTQNSPAADLSDDTFHQSTKKEYAYESFDDESFEDDDEAEDPAQQCEYQGFASVNIYGSETFTLGGKSDSTYEYLPKEYLLLGGRLEQYKTMYLESMKPVIEKLLFRPMTIDDLDILVSGELDAVMDHSSGDVTYNHKGKIEHLTCFAGGMFAMGGKLFDMPEHVEIGRKLTEGCVWAYNSTNSGVMPDGGLLMVCADQKQCKWNQTAWYEALDYLEPHIRDQQVEDWKKAYEVDDIEAWRKQKALDEAAEASAMLAAAQAAATAAPRLDFDNGADFTEDDDFSAHRYSKRQLDDYDDELPPPPQPLPTPPLNRFSSTLVDDEEESDGEGETWDDRPSFADSWDEPTATEPAKPTYTPEPPATHKEFVKKKIEEERIPPGFAHVGGNGYLLRPEAIESVFYMYRITGEQYWRDVGWKMFVATETATRAEFGHSSLDDVTKTHPRQTDKMESFWIAETLKYYYLLFDDPDSWSLDDWVLNTEAHFFERPKAPRSE